jgi:hypothetical protein
MLGEAGCRFGRTENPRVGGSIPPLATIQIIVHSEDMGDGLHKAHQPDLLLDLGVIAGGGR